VRSILITTGASLSTDAIQLAIEKNIDIIFLDAVGQPYGRVWHGRPGSTTAIRREQLRIADTEQGLKLALGWMVRKLDNQIEFLRGARQRRSRLSAQLTEKIEALSASRVSLEAVSGALDEARGTIMGIEGRAGRTYWEAVNLMLPEAFRFQERSRNPAKDEFNCLLNWADETVIGLFAARKVKQTQFAKLENGLRLNKEGKAVLMESFGSHLDEGIRYRNRNIKRRDTVQLDCHHLANGWIGRLSDEDD